MDVDVIPEPKPEKPVVRGRMEMTTSGSKIVLRLIPATSEVRLTVEEARAMSDHLRSLCVYAETRN